MTDDPELDDLREQTQSGSRIAEAKKRTKSFEEHVADALDAVDDGEVNRTLSLYDARLAAFVAALENDDEAYRSVIGGLRDALGDDTPVDLDDVDRSELLGLAVRVGLQEGASAEFETVQEVVRDRANF